MKIKIKTLKKELKGPDDDKKTKIIRAFINAQEGSDHKELKEILSSILGVGKHCEAISYLSKEEVAPQLYTKAVEIHNSFCKNQIKVDAFGNFPQIGHDPNQVPGGNKNAEPGRNFMQENNMKISKEYLKQIIQEEINSVLEAKEEDEHPDPLHRSHWKEDEEDKKYEDEDEDHPDPLHPSHWKKKKKKES